MADPAEEIKKYSLEGLFEMIPDLETKTLLDVGAGQSMCCGRAYIKALGKHKEHPEQYGKNVTLIDERDIHDIIDTETNESIFKEIIKHDIEKGLPFKDETFEIVALGRLLNHFEDFFDAIQLLAEVMRVTKKGGHILGDFPVKANDNELYDILKKGSKEVARDLDIEFLINKLGYDSRKAYENENCLMFYFLAQKN